MKVDSCVGDRARFSVIIPTFNRPAELRRCMAAIAAVRYPRDRFEVIVVNDGGSPTALDDLIAIAGDLRLLILSERNGGPARARNTGAAAAHGDFLAFIDDDCIPPPDWLIKLAAAVEREPDALVGGRTVNVLSENIFSRASQTLLDYVYRYYNEPAAGRTQFFASNNLAVSAGEFHQIGGFDDKFRTAEDRELCKRWHMNGGRFYYAPDVVMYHAHRLNLASLNQQHFAYGRGALPYWKKFSALEPYGIRVEPPDFYAGMLRFPFTQGERHPALLSALILMSQISNAAGFAVEGLTRLASRERAAPMAGALANPSGDRAHRAPAPL